MKNIIGDENLIPSDFPELAKSVGPDAKILLDDGLLELKVIAVAGDEVKSKVIYGGKLKDRKRSGQYQIRI